MNLNDPELVKRYGHWVRVQIAFNDFLWREASQQCPQCLNQNLLQNFKDGGNEYDTLTRVMEQEFPTIEVAWQLFLKSHTPV